jgi:acyl carrier protein
MDEGTMSSSHDQVLTSFANLLREIIGESWVNDLDINRETSFSTDLELESIEFVALAEKLQQQYGAKVDFANWLADKELDQIIGLTVGDVVDFIVAALASSEAA